MSIQLQDGLINQSVDLVLEDLLARFVVNVPDEDLSSIERVFFQVEEAQWFYTDFVRHMNPMLPSMKMKSFSAELLEKCPVIWKWGNPSEAISRFGKYKSTIPVRGIALFNKDLTKILLVQGTESNSWSFPRGKISKDETDIDCAVREVEEEIGFNARELINENDVIERTIRGKNYKIYLAKNVPEDINFQPVARNEISKVQWHDIKTIQKKHKTNPNSYFILATVFKLMMRWVNKNKGILNDEDLMLKTEIKLKAILGINLKKQENIDAGRELLDILQGVSRGDNLSTNVDNSQVPLQMNIPQHLYNQIPQFAPVSFVPQPMQFMNQNYILHQPMNAPYFVPPTSSQMNYVPVPNVSSPSINEQPLNVKNTKTLPFANMRSTEADSKELLSILISKGNKKENVNGPKKSQTNEDSILSKPQEFLNLINKSREDSSEKSIKHSVPFSSFHGSPQPSNELEENLRIPLENIESGRKLTILKRSDKNEGDDKKASADLLSLLHKPSVKSDNISSGTDVQTNKESSFTKQVPYTLNADIKSSIDEPASEALLGLLNKNKNKEIDQEQNVKKVKENDTRMEDISSGDFEEFEEFEDFQDTYETQPQSEYHYFDIESDEEDYLEPNVPQPNTYLTPLNRKSPVKMRILKPGESLNELFNTKKDSSGSSEIKNGLPNKDNGKSLLHLLNGSDSNKPEESNSNSNNFSSIYGTNGDAVENKPTDNKLFSDLNQKRLDAVNNSSKGAAANLLSLLGKRPSISSQVNGKEHAPTYSNALTLDDLESNNSNPDYKNSSNDSSRELLSILKGKKL